MGKGCTLCRFFLGVFAVVAVCGAIAATVKLRKTVWGCSDSSSCTSCTMMGCYWFEGSKKCSSNINAGPNPTTIVNATCWTCQELSSQTCEWCSGDTCFSSPGMPNDDQNKVCGQERDCVSCLGISGSFACGGAVLDAVFGSAVLKMVLFVAIAALALCFVCSVGLLVCAMCGCRDGGKKAGSHHGDTNLLQPSKSSGYVPAQPVLATPLVQHAPQAQVPVSSYSAAQAPRAQPVVGGYDPFQSASGSQSRGASAAAPRVSSPSSPGISGPGPQGRQSGGTHAMTVDWTRAFD